MDRSHTSRGGSLGPLLGGGAIAVAGLLAALALVYTNATGVNLIARESRIQQESESALGTVAAARNAVGQVLILASSDSLDPDFVIAWTEEARAVLDDMGERVDRLVASTGSPTGLRAAADAALLESEETLLLISQGDLDAASDLALSAVTESFDELTDRLVEVRDEAALAIATADQKAGSVATSSRFMVALFVPLAAVSIGWFALRRRRKRERLATQLEKERSINRSKDQLIANLSHELRTPLTGIYTSALAMEESNHADPGLARELTSLIVDQSADLTRMVEDLLVSAQAEAGRLSFAIEPVSVVELLVGVIAEIDRQGSHVDLDADDFDVLADPGRLRQLLRNLLSNAVRHGGPTIRVRGREAGEDYLVQVIDDGDGVPEDLEPRLFERFIHRGDRPLVVGSVGLGLAITKVLAEGMGGTIDYQRHAGRTVFAVRLRPAEQPEAVAA